MTIKVSCLEEELYKRENTIVQKEAIMSKFVKKVKKNILFSPHSNYLFLFNLLFLLEPKFGERSDKVK